MDDLDGRIRKLLDAKRGNLINDAVFSAQMAVSGERVCELWARPVRTHWNPRQSAA